MLVLFMDFLYMSFKNGLFFFFFKVLDNLRDILQVIYLGLKEIIKLRKKKRKYMLGYQASHHFGPLERV